VFKSLKNKLQRNFNIKFQLGRVVFMELLKLQLMSLQSATVVRQLTEANNEIGKFILYLKIASKV